MIPAAVAVQRASDARLMVVDASGEVAHKRRTDFPALVHSGDLVIANDAATLPASLSGTHLATGSPIELRLAGRRSLGSQHIDTFTAVAFGAGDFRTPTESRPLPPPFSVGDALQLGPLHAVVREILEHPRLIEVRFEGSGQEIWEGLARHGHPIQYSYLSAPLALWDTWTTIASRPVAFEAPSAGFLLDWRLVDSLRTRGATFATLTHAAGISSTGDVRLDAMLPLAEAYEIPLRTANAIDAAQRRGGRIIAVGTTVVRALEDSSPYDGCVRAGRAVATLKIGPLTRLRIVDALVTGQHEPGTSHYELLRAFQDDSVLRRAIEEAEMHAYRTHEFGDSLFIVRGQRMTWQSFTTTSDIPRGRFSEPASDSGQTAGRSG
jgi:S-adenosylmethionine:tRNA ribosyltransferase-isomerase